MGFAHSLSLVDSASAADGLQSSDDCDNACDAATWTPGLRQPPGMRSDALAVRLPGIYDGGCTAGVTLTFAALN